MAQLDTKKIDNALKQLENAAKGAVRALNEMTENSYKESPFEKEPLQNIGLIGLTLLMAQEQLKSQAKYAGLDAEQVAALQAEERQTERQTLQLQVQDKLAKRHALPEPEPEIVEETESGEGDADPANPDA